MVFTQSLYMACNIPNMIQERNTTAFTRNAGAEATRKKIA